MVVYEYIMVQYDLELSDRLQYWVTRYCIPYSVM